MVERQALCSRRSAPGTSSTRTWTKTGAPFAYRGKITKWTLSKSHHSRPSSPARDNHRGDLLRRQALVQRQAGRRSRHSRPERRQRGLGGPPVADSYLQERQERDGARSRYRDRSGHAGIGQAGLGDRVRALARPSEPPKPYKQ